MKSIARLMQIVAIVSGVFASSTVFAEWDPATLDKVEFERAIREVPLMGTDIMPSIEETLIKKGFGRAKDDRAFGVDWEGTEFTANIYYSNAELAQAVTILLMGNRDEATGVVTIYTVIANPESL